MKKAYAFDVMSSKICDERGCSKLLKLRLVQNKAPENITKCFKHDQITRRSEQRRKDLRHRR